MCTATPVTNYFLCCRYWVIGDSSRTITGSFRVGISTVSMIVPDATAAIRDILMLEFSVCAQHKEVEVFWGVVEFTSLSWSCRWETSNGSSKPLHSQDPSFLTTREHFLLLTSKSGINMRAIEGPVMVRSWPTYSLIRLWRQTVLT